MYMVIVFFSFLMKVLFFIWRTNFVPTLRCTNLKCAFQRILTKEYPLITASIKMKSISLNSQSSSCLFLQRHTGGLPCEDSDIAVTPGTERVGGHHQSEEEARKDSIQSPRRSLVLLTPWLWASSVLNCERIHFYCFKLPVCGTLLQQA